VRRRSATWLCQLTPENHQEPRSASVRRLARREPGRFKGMEVPDTDVDHEFNTGMQMCWTSRRGRADKKKYLTRVSAPRLMYRNEICLVKRSDASGCVSRNNRCRSDLEVVKCSLTTQCTVTLDRVIYVWYNFTTTGHVSNKTEQHQLGAARSNRPRNGESEKPSLWSFAFHHLSRSD